MKKDIILAIDQGTTGTTALLINQKLKVLAKVNQEFSQHFPKNAWVEHDLKDIWKSTTDVIKKVIRKAKINPKKIAAIGITNQRETTAIWDKKSGKPIHRAIVWQCRRTSDYCEKLKKAGHGPQVYKKTGLMIDAYFSASKIKWLLDNVPGAKSQAKKGELAFGTMDSFLLYQLSGKRCHVTDVSNASRTMLMNIKTLNWDQDLLKLFKIPQSMLPEIKSCSEVYAHTKSVPGLPDGIPIAGMAGDQQAALFGQACFEVGTAKCTYGTGSFILLNTGKKLVYSKNHLLTTVAWQVGKEVNYALEGSNFIAGAAVQWLRDGLGLIKSAPEIEQLAQTVPDSDEVYFVPALAGLGSPHWRGEARGVITGLTRRTTAAHLARATLEGIAFSQADILTAMSKDLGKKLKRLKVDGGASKNNLLMQFQSDILGIQLNRPRVVETTGLGAAFLAGLAVGLWKNQKEISQSWQSDRDFAPQISSSERKKKFTAWQNAISKA